MARKRRQELKDNSFINIQGWMARLTKKDGRVLSLPELIIFANIFGFSQDEKSRYMGGISYLMDFLHLSKPTVLAHLSTLENEGLIGRFEYENGDVDYFVTPDSFGKEILPNEGSNGKESLPEKNFNRLNNFTETGKEILPKSDSDLFNNKNKKNKDIDACAAAPATGAAAPVSKSLVFDIDDNDEKSGEAATPTPGPAAPAPAAPAKSKKSKAFDFAAALIARGASEDRALAWTAARKRLGGSNTECAFNLLVPEFDLAARAGYEMNDCLDKALDGKVWIGFKAAWMHDDRPVAPVVPAAPAATPKPVRRF